jgi:RHS repeat-associated protein
LPDGTLGNEVVETFEAYDERGRLLRHINPVGTLTINTYFDDSAGKREGFPRRTVVDPDGLAITTEYNMDELGRVTEVHLPRSVDAPAGQFVIGLKYNPLDQLTQLTTPGPFAFKTRRFYDPNGKLEREENDAKDETGADIPDAPSVSAFCYDSEFNLTKTTIGGSDRSAHLITRHCYDSAGQRVLTLLPKGNQVRTRYDERLLPVTRILGDGTENAATSRTEYDGDGRVRRTFDARGNPNTFLLDPFDRVIAEENALGHIIRHDYDNSGNVRFVRVFEKREDGYYLLSRSQTDYDELGRAIATGMNRFDDPPGPHQKDNLKNAFLVSPGPGELLVSRTFYDAGGRVERAIDALGRETHFEYDTLDRVKVQIDPLGNRVENHYDAHGNLIRLDRHDLVRDPETGDVSGHRFFSTSSTYDQLDRMVTSIDSLGNVTRYAYNSRDNLVRRIDALGNVVQTEFDIYNRRVAEKRLQKDTGLGGGIPLAPPEAVDRFQYDDNSNLVTVTDALTRHTNYTFDPLDRRRAIIYPDGRQTTFDYDPDGNLLLTRDNNGLQRHFTVDRLGRTTRVDVDKTGTVIEVEGATFEVYSYDGLDRRYHEENDFARCDIRFNSLDWPVEEVITFNTPEEPLVAPLLIAREFNHVGAVTGLIYPNGRRLHFHRDDLDRLTRVENLVKGTNYPGHSDTPDGHDIAKMEYLGRQRSRCIFGNGAQASYAYDGAARSIEIAHTSPVEPLMRFQYLFDAVGNMRFRNDIEPPGNIGEAFKYDSFYRLANEAFEDKTPFDTASFAPAATLPPDPIPDRQADINSHIGPLELPTGVMTFDYDLVSNRKTEQLADGGDAIYEKNNLDQYIEREETLSGDSASFQYDGNGNLKSDGTRDYIYDSLNRLVKMIGPAGDVRFFHDARGRCIFESGIAGKTHLVWDDTNLIAEYREGNPFTHYVHDDVVDRPLQIVVKVFGGASHELWYHTDLTGSVRMLTDRDGNVVATYRYNPFGQVLEISGGDLYNPVRYAGRRLDEDLGTYDFRARQYDPQIGRFLQRDPLGIVDGTNLYMYTANNPLVFADPFGTDKRPEFEQSGQLDELWCDADTAAEEEAQLWKMRLNPPSSIGPAPHPSQIYVEYKNWYNSDYYFREYRPMYEKVSDSKQKVFNVPVEDIAPPPGHYTNNPFQTVPFEVGYIYRRIDTTGNLLPYVGQSETREKMYNRWYRQDYPNSSFIYQVIDRALWAPKPRRGTISSPLDIAEESNIRAEGGPWVYEGNLSNLRYQVNLELYEHLGGNIPRPTNNKRIPERWELRPKPARSRRPPPRASRARK